MMFTFSFHSNSYLWKKISRLYIFCENKLIKANLNGYLQHVYGKNKKNIHVDVQMSYFSTFYK